jgi:hypothetical protein
MNQARCFRSLVFSGLGVALVLVLSGCSIFGSEAEPVCPRVSILKEAAQITQFRPGPGRDLSDILFRGKLGGFQAECDYDDGELLVDLGLLFLAERGTADRSRVGVFEYFVAVADASGTVIEKKRFSARVEFPENVSRASFVEELSLRDIRVAAPEDGEMYSVFAGFQLSDEQLDYNRKESAR